MMQDGALSFSLSLSPSLSSSFFFFCVEQDGNAFFSSSIVLSLDLI